MRIGSACAWHGVVLSLLCAWLFFFPIQDLPFSNKGEAREAVVVQTMVNEGNWLFPLRPSGRVPSKPPLFHWIGGLASVAYGHTTEATVRFPSALLATLGVFLVYALGRRMFGADCGFWGGVILATSLDYQYLAVSARVDMTLTFFVTASLVMFYFLDAAYISGVVWRIVFYVILGLGVLAKGPVSVVLVVMVIGLFYAQARRWEDLRRFLFSRLMLLTVTIVALWYGMAMVRDGEDFFRKQILRENLLRFWAFGNEGTGHTKPFYFYIPYLFINGLPWTLFLPFAALDGLRARTTCGQRVRFLLLWVGAVFVFFSISAGKRADYLLPLYPALALLISHWLNVHVHPAREERLGLSFAAGFFLLIGALFSALLWDAVSAPGFRFLELLAAQLRAGDQQQVLWVARAFERQTWVIGAVFLLFAAVSFLLARALWRAHLQPVRVSVVLLAILGFGLAQFVSLKAIAESKSYAPFAADVREELQRGGRIYFYGDGFDKNQIIFYHGGPIPVLSDGPQELAERLRWENDVVILTEHEWRKIAGLDSTLPAPVVKSAGGGPDGDAPLVLIRGAGVRLRDGARGVAAGNGNRPDL